MDIFPYRSKLRSGTGTSQLGGKIQENVKIGVIGKLYMRKTKLIIICGLPASGKTTLAQTLSQKLNIAYLSKDIIKENLYDILQGKTLDDSKKTGLQAIQMLFSLVEHQLKNQVDIIMEAPFNFKEDYILFKKWIKK